MPARVLQALRDHGPLSRTKLRERLDVKNALLGDALRTLEIDGRIERDSGLTKSATSPLPSARQVPTTDDDVRSSPLPTEL